MKLWTIFRFELAYQARRAWPWLFGVAIVVVAYMLARDNSLADAMFEDFYVNSPFSIAKSTVIATLFWLMAGAAIAGEAGARDVATQMHPLVFTAPISKMEYLGGRFLAALSINAVLLFLAQVGIFLGIYVPAMAGSNIGPFRIVAYLTAFAYLSLPNAIFATALQFWLALRTGRPIVSYLGSFVLFFMGFFVASFVRYFVRPKLGFLLDPIGINFVVDGLAHDWTTIEKKTRLLSPDGIVLENRLVWLSVGFAALVLTYATFRFAHRAATTWRFPWRQRTGIQTGIAHPVSGIRYPASGIQQDNHSFRFHVRQTGVIVWTSFRALASSWTGLALLVFIPLLMVLVVLQQMSALGTPLLPTTPLVLREMTAPLSAQLSRWVIIPPLIVFFAGELVWRERDAGLGEIFGALPGSEWPPLVGKFLGLSLMLATLMAALMASGMLAQTISDYHDYEIGVYIKILFGLQLPEYLLFAALALSVHVIVNQKYLGHFVGMIAYVYIAILAGILGVEHNLLVYSASPGWMYTAMRGFGPEIVPWLWFKSYWAAWALLLAVSSRLLWVRGKETGFAMRLRVARQRLTVPTRAIAATSVVLLLGVGGYVFYNTNIRHVYLTRAAVKDLLAGYEQRYGRFENAPQPRMTGAKLRVDLHPRSGSADIRGSYQLVNRTAARIDSIHVTTGSSGDTRGIAFDRASKLTTNDQEHAYRIYTLEQPLEPGDSVRMDFEVHVEPNGFSNHGVDPSISPKGTFFTNAKWFPSIGFQTSRALISAADRRAYGLAPRPILGALYDDSQDASPRGDGVAFEAVMSTDADQMAVVPGDLRRSWTEGGRRFFEYATSAPIGGEWSFFSSQYAVREDSLNGVTIRIFHDPRHTAHLDRVLRSARASLEYYGSQFGPYRYRHLSIVERPGAPGSSAHADPAIIYHGESYASWIPRSGPARLDMPYDVMSHEMAHEWPHPYALVEGLPFLGEGLAWYFGLNLVEQSRGEEQVRQLLTFMRGPYPYPMIRRGEPLLRAMDPYMSYRKGPMAMYALSKYIGTDRVNGVIRRLFEKHAAPDAPLATTLDLYRGLQEVTPDSLRPMLRDFFEVNAFWQLSTEHVSAVEKIAGTWEVTLDVRARKMVYDTAGVVSELPLDQWIPVGVFATADAGHTELSKPLYLELHHIRSGRQRITITVHGTPQLAGIDPNHLLDWEEREDDDNVEPVPLPPKPRSAK